MLIIDLDKLQDIYFWFQTYFNKKGQSVLFKGKEAEHMMLSTLGERHQVSKAVSIYRFSFQHLHKDIGDI